MTDDLVARLRAYDCGDGSHPGVADEAADEIERLQQRIGEAENRIETDGRELEQLRAETKRAEAVERALADDRGAAAWIMEWIVAEKYSKPPAPEWLADARRHYKAEIKKLGDTERALAEAQKDAERYRWLRQIHSACEVVFDVESDLTAPWEAKHGTELDAAIDAAKDKPA